LTFEFKLWNEFNSKKNNSSIEKEKKNVMKTKTKIKIKKSN